MVFERFRGDNQELTDICYTFLKCVEKKIFLPLGRSFGRKQYRGGISATLHRDGQKPTDGDNDGPQDQA